METGNEVSNENVKRQNKFYKFFSNVSFLSVADTVPEGTQLELMRALKEVEWQPYGVI